MNLERQDKHHLNAAEGWLGLGDHLAANDELENIAPQLRGHPAVLNVRYRIYAATKRWEGAVDIARAISEIEPNSSFGFIQCAYSLHESKRTREALETLLPVADRFPGEWIIAYNLSCYHCQLGDLETAIKWLERAIDVSGEHDDIRQMALDDPDLKALEAEIAEI